MAEKPITVATDEAINSLTDNRQCRLAVCFRRSNRINKIAPESIANAPGIVAAGLNRDSGSAMG
jgi:hypothetical protein